MSKDVENQINNIKLFIELFPDIRYSFVSSSQMDAISVYSDELRKIYSMCHDISILMKDDNIQRKGEIIDMFSQNIEIMLSTIYAVYQICGEEKLSTMIDALHAFKKHM